MPDLKVEGLVKDWCAACTHCAGKKRLDGHTYYICEDPYDGVTTESDAEDNILCNMFEPKGDVLMEKKDCTNGSYSFGNDVDNVIKYSANDVVIIAKAMAEEKYSEKQKELECKIKDLTDTNNKLMERNVELVAQCDEIYGELRNCKKLLNDILNEVYEHPEMFERNMTTYLLLPGRVKTLKDSWDMMCDKYDPLNIENEQRKKAMDNQAKMIQDLKKEHDELTEKLKNVDISKVPKLEARIKNLEYLNEESYKREEALEKTVKFLEGSRDRLTNTISELTFENRVNKKTIVQLREILEKTEE